MSNKFWSMSNKLCGSKPGYVFASHWVSSTVSTAAIILVSVLVLTNQPAGCGPIVSGNCSAGVPEPYDVRARANENSAILVATKAGYDEAISHYPEQSDVVLTNMLSQFGLTRTGNDTGATASDQQADAEGYTHLRGAIKVWHTRAELPRIELLHMLP